MWRPIDATTEQPLVWSKRDWPIAIHGTPKQGSSFYTVALTADLIRRGVRVVYLCAKAEGVRALQEELAIRRAATTYQSVTASASTELRDMQLVTIIKKSGVDILESLRALVDWSERVIVIKNCDQLLTPALWAVVKPHRQLVLSGDFSHLPFDVDPKIFSTSIGFSAWPSEWPYQRGSLPTYVGDGYRAGRHFQTIVQNTSGD